MAAGEGIPANIGSIPANTQLQTSLQVMSSNENSPAYVELTVRTTNETIVKCVMIFAEGETRCVSIRFNGPLSSCNKPEKASSDTDQASFYFFDRSSNQSIGSISYIIEI